MNAIFLEWSMKEIYNNLEGIYLSFLHASRLHISFFTTESQI